LVYVREIGSTITVSTTSVMPKQELAIAGTPASKRRSNLYQTAPFCATHRTNHSKFAGLQVLCCERASSTGMQRLQGFCRARVGTSWLCFFKRKASADCAC
jgi:hypothetical protein